MPAGVRGCISFCIRPKAIILQCESIISRFAEEKYFTQKNRANSKKRMLGFLFTCRVASKYAFKKYLLFMQTLRQFTAFCK